MRYCLDKKTTRLLYNSLILPYLNYCCIVWGNNYDSQLNRLVILQKRAIRLIEHVYPPTSSEPIFKQYNLLKLNDIAKTQMLVVMHKFITKELPSALNHLYKLQDHVVLNTRQIQHLKQPFSNRNYRLFTSRYIGPKLWNEIMTSQYPSLDDIPTSKSAIKKSSRKYFVATYGR